MTVDRGKGGGDGIPGRVLPVSFYRRNTLLVARELLGCLVGRMEAAGGWTVGRIVETEAYIGEDDPACHAAAGLTPRTRILYGPPGRSYVYFTYGMHHLLNAVTERAGFPAAVLIRALRPIGGIEAMTRRSPRVPAGALTSGPARLCRALGIDLRLNGVPLSGPDLVIAQDGERPEAIAEGPRVGIRRGTDRPWRFWVAGDPHVSRGRPGAPPSRRRLDTAGAVPSIS